MTHKMMMFAVVLTTIAASSGAIFLLNTFYNRYLQPPAKQCVPEPGKCVYDGVGVYCILPKREPR